MSTLQTFAEALKHDTEKRPHLLLGNGFSRACRDDIFSYDSLFDRADFKTLPKAKAAFNALKTTDFEAVMRALRSAAALVRVYEPTNKALAQVLADEADALKDVLVRAIASNHPDHPSEIPDTQYARCKQFLANFNRIFTLNYDLLLYWALMRAEVEPLVKCDDGFRTPDSGKEEYVTWEPENTHYQNVYYLHGALHIFDSQTEVQKYTWANTQVRLIIQIREALDRGLYPLFVAEGDSKQKVERIRHSDFLDKALRSLLSIGGSIFIYGHSMGPSDEHILRALTKSKLELLVVGIFGDSSSDGNKRIMKRAERIAIDRKKGKKLSVQFFQAETAHVWK